MSLSVFLLYQSSFNNPEWFYRHVDMHAHCTELQPLPDRQQALFCSWSGRCFLQNRNASPVFIMFLCETLLLFLQAVMLSLKSSTVYVSICAVIHKSGWSLAPPAAVCSPATPSSLTISKDKQNQKVSLFQIVSLHSLTVQQHWCLRMSIKCL